MVSQTNCLWLAIYVILAVCVYDIYCTVHLSDHLASGEQNPVARMLITVRHENRLHLTATGIRSNIVFQTVDVSRLVLFKVAGLLASERIFAWLMKSSHRRIAVAVIGSVLAVQCVLLWRLTS